MDQFTEPGTLDLTQRMPSHPGLADDVAASRAWCDELGHVPVTYNPVHDLTYCSCGLVTYPGDHGELPLPRVIAPQGAPVTDPAWTYRRRKPTTR
jgi:hypothetical protein